MRGSNEQLRMTTSVICNALSTKGGNGGIYLSVSQIVRRRRNNLNSIDTIMSGIICSEGSTLNMCLNMFQTLSRCAALK